MPSSIGSAIMRSDRTIELKLRAETPDGMTDAFGYFVYPPSHEQYQMISDHLPDLVPGGHAIPCPPFEDVQ